MYQTGTGFRIVLNKTYIMPVSIKRAYESPTPGDGYRVLVDRLWPRGVSKEKVELDDWLREIAPSDDLRTWFDHDPERWEEFRKRYRSELDEHREALRSLARLAADGKLTLVYGAKDREHNNAVVVKDYIEEMKSQ